MRPSRFGAALVGGFLFFAGAAVADRLPGDPVEELKQALRNPTDKATLDRRVAALRSLGEMRRALVLEWSPEALKSREVLIDRFQTDVRAALRDGDLPTRLATATMIGELGVGGSVPDAAGLAALFIGDLAEIVRRGEPRISETAARSLGKIAQDTKTTVPALGQLITASSPTQRLAAADALYEMLNVLIQIASTVSKQAIRVELADLARIGQGVVPAAAQGLTDESTAVRHRSIEAIHMASTILLRFIGPRQVGMDLKPEALLRERQELAPLINALITQVPALSRALSDSNVDVRRLAGRTLENMGTARELLRRPSSPIAVPPPIKQGRGGAEVNPDGPTLGSAEVGELQLGVRQAMAQVGGDDPLLPGLRAVLPALTEAVSDPDERVRLAVIDVLETMGPEAAPALPALVRALEDRSRFVRWSAARAVGRVGPVAGASAAIPGLIRLLRDSDLDVCLAATGGLDRLGPVARDAVLPLAETVKARDAVLRMASLRALVGIGSIAVPALPAMTAALEDPDARVRRTAAESLGRFGPLARDSVGALTKALNDTDGDVRRAASDALLGIRAGK